MSTLEFPAIPWQSPRAAAYGIEALRPAEFQFTQSCCTTSSPSPLEDSLREACLPELNARLRQERFEPPGKGVGGWRSHMRFGHALPGEQRGDSFQPVESPGGYGCWVARGLTESCSG